MDKYEISIAQLNIDMGKFHEAHEILAPLLERDVPEALFLYSTFSLAGSESEQDFERRSIELLRRAADFCYAPALYALGVCYETGDMVEEDSTHAATLLRAAAEMGNEKAKFRHGLNVLYGSNGIEKDELIGLKLIKEAAKNGVEDADDYLLSHGF